MGEFAGDEGGDDAARYTITRHGITLGLAADKVGDGYVYEKIKEHAGTPGAAREPKDWDSALGWVTVGGVRSDTPGMLLYAGLTNMVLQSSEPASSGDVPGGTEIMVHLLSGRLDTVLRRETVRTPSRRAK